MSTQLHFLDLVSKTDMILATEIDIGAVPSKAIVKIRIGLKKGSQSLS